MKKPIGLHIHDRRADDLVRRYIIDVRPKVMKWLAGGVNPSLVQLANEHGALTILRLYEPDQRLGSPGEEEYLRRVEKLLIQWPQFAAVEGYNEAFQRIPDIRRRAEFDIRLMELCERYGKKAVIGSFSVGQPQWPATGHADDWAAYLPALRHAAKHGHLVGLHEYGAPAMQWGVGENQAKHLQNGRWANFDPATRPGVKGWFVLRYRRVLDHWRELGLDPVPKIVITESGIDDIQPRPDVGTRRGYKTYKGTEWWQHPVLGDYATQLGWVCERWAEDPEVVGGVDFGFADVSGDWGDFDMSTDPETFDRVREVMMALEDSVGPPPPPPPDAPDAPDDGALYRSYTVQPGDTLWGLFGSRWPEILRTVPMGRPEDLEVGATVLIPADGDESPSDPPPPLYELKVLSPTPHRHRDGRRRVRWIILHDPGVEVSTQRILTALYRPDFKASYHRLLGNDPEPVVYEMVPIDQVAWHAGAVTRIPGTDVTNSDVNLFTWSLSINYPLPDRSYPALVQAVADMVTEADLPDAGVVLAHAEVSTVPGRRSDPRGIDMDRLRSDVQVELDRRREID